MLAQYSLGEYKPDLADSPDHLKVARNVRAIANGYGPVQSFSAITPTLDGQFVGGGAFVQSNGTSHFLAARSDALRAYSGGLWTDVLTGLATERRWNLSQFGDRVIVANGLSPYYYDMASGIAAVIADAPTNAIDGATVGDFVMLLTDDRKVVWSGFNNSDQWTIGENQSDEQPLLDGGEGVRILASPGGHEALILQQESVRRFRYTGGDVIFSNEVIASGIGCMAAGSACNIGTMSFFLSERGFYSYDGQQFLQIGSEKVDRWFFSRFSREDIANISSAINPRAPEVYWAMPGTPGLILCYNWVLSRWFTIETDVSGLFNGFTANVSIDALDALYPTGIDDIPLSLDDPAFRGGNPLLLVVDGDDIIGTLAGDNLEASVTIPAIEPTPGKRSRIRSVRPVTDATSAEVSINARMRRGDDESIRSANSLRTNGKAPLRSNGRYNDVTVTIPAGERWTDIQGCEIEFEAGDGR